jgi:uncharacterized membrane protein YfcA
VHIDFALAFAGLIVGFVVGLTGMGGGALMTPILVLILKVTPSAAVASDLVASLVMKPVGAAVHAKRGTVNKSLVLWLCIGSVPAAFAGVFVLQAIGGKDVQNTIKVALGIALLLAAATMVLKNVVSKRRGIVPDPNAVIKVKPVPTLIIGFFGGLIVGMTSVGSGSLIIVALLVLYPVLTAKQLVGTDLVQAIPLVGAAALGHVLFGDFQFGLTFSLLLGAIPAVYVGARVSSKAPDSIIRPALVIVLGLSALKLLNVSNTVLLGVLVGSTAVMLASAVIRRRRAAQAALAAPPGDVAEALATS